MTPEPSAEVKQVLSAFVRVQKEKYGDDWKSKLAKELAAKTTPIVVALLELRKPK